MSGGRHPLEKTGREQRAIVEMLCKKGVKGTEGEWDPSDKYEKVPFEAESAEGEEEGKEGDGAGEGGEDGGDGKTEHQLMMANASLIFDSYGPMADNGNVDVLRLTWHTELACEDAPTDGGSSSSSSHWGFFTWMIIL